jgi:hypothetical protein
MVHSALLASLKWRTASGADVTIAISDVMLEWSPSQ